MVLDEGETLEVAIKTAIHEGNVGRLKELLDATPGLEAARIGDPCGPGMSRTLLHVATDWPGHFPRVAETIALLISRGADPNARFTGPHTETPLHWAASSDDVDALDALLDGGADIEAEGAVIAGGSPLADAVAFAQWKAARRLIERGAKANLWQAAGLGLMDRIEAAFSEEPRPSEQDVTGAFWIACHGGQRAAAECLLAQGADLNWVGYDMLTPLDAARRSKADEVAAWLLVQGARTADSAASSSMGQA